MRAQVGRPESASKCRQPVALGFHAAGAAGAAQTSSDSSPQSQLIYAARNAVAESDSRRQAVWQPRPVHQLFHP